MATQERSDEHVLCVREHVLPQVLFSDERSVAEIALELLRAGVDEHV